MTSFYAQPEARVLWSLRRRRSDVRCVMYSGTVPVEVRVMQDRDVVLTELFPEERTAENWARVYADHLKHQGWFESPDG